MQSTLNDPAADGVWRQLAPHLEDAMTRLNEKERTLLALRFFENKSGAEAAALLGIQEWAAHKRTTRALEKLRKFFTKRGVSSTTAIIAGTISANSVQAAPVALAKSVTAVAITKGAAASGSTLTLIKGALKIMAWTKIKTAVVVGVILVGAVTTAVVVKHQNKPPGDTLTRQPVVWGSISFTNAGYQTPQASLRTMLWAMSNGDTDTFLAGCSPELKAKMEKMWQRKSKEALTAEGKRQLNGVTGIKITHQTTVADDLVAVAVYLEGVGRTQKLMFRKIGDDWKRDQ